MLLSGLSLLLLLFPSLPVPLPNSFDIVPSTPTAIDITVTFMFHSLFFSSLARSRYVSLFSLFFIFTLWSARMAKFTIRQSLSPFFFCCLSLGQVIWPRLGDPSKSFASHFPECLYHLFVARSRYVSLFSLFFIFTLWSARMAKSTIRQSLSPFFFFVAYH